MEYLDDFSFTPQYHGVLPTNLLLCFKVLHVLSQDFLRARKKLKLSLRKIDFLVTFPKVPSYRLMKYGIKVLSAKLEQNLLVSLFGPMITFPIFIWRLT